MDFTIPNVPGIGNLLETATSPAGTIPQVTSFRLAGSPVAVTPGSGPVPIKDAKGNTAGTLAIQPGGSYTFTAAPGFQGPLPPVSVTVSNSDGQAKVTTLTLGVNPLLLDGSEIVQTAPGGPPIVADLLANVVPPPGTTVNVTSFTLPGSTLVYPVGPAPVTVTDPLTNRVAGTVSVTVDGQATFTPAPGYGGEVPPITYMVASSDGQLSPAALSVIAQPGEPHGCIGRPFAAPHDGTP